MFYKIGKTRQQTCFCPGLWVDQPGHGLHPDLWPLCCGCSWEQEKTHEHVHRDRTPERDEEPAEADVDGVEGESSEPHEVALAREEVNMLLAEQRKTAALKVGEGAMCAGSQQWCDHGTPDGACHRCPVDGNQAQGAEMSCSTSPGTGEADGGVPALHASDGRRGWQGSGRRRGCLGDRGASGRGDRAAPACLHRQPPSLSRVAEPPA